MVLEDIVMMVVFGVLGLAGLGLLYKRLQWKAEARNKDLDLRRDIVAKFSSAAEFVEFARSEAGKDLFLGPEESPRGRFSRLLAASVMMALAGAAMFLNGYAWRHATDTNDIGKTQDYYYWASLCAAASLGLLVHAFLGRSSGRKNAK